MSEERPKVGVGVIIFKDGKLLLGKRKGSHGEFEFGPGGGHLEYMESFEDGIRREIREENGIELENLRFLCVSNVVQYAPKHYVDVAFVADWKSGEPKVLEKDRFESWGWYDLDNLPEPLFVFLKNYLEAYRTGRVFFDF